MAELSATMTRRTITATITGLSEEHTSGRTFHWYLDGVLIGSESTTSTETTQTYTYNSVPYLAQHTVSVKVNNYADDTEFGTFTATVDDTLRLWSWTASNGSATAEQTQAAYTAAANQGQTADFGYLVWNDLVNTLANASDTWKTGYATLDDTLMVAKYDALTAGRFNSVVQNIGYPWMFWASNPNRTGYLGRLAVRGCTDSGADADSVYGAYLIELADKLNVLIDAFGEFDAGYAKRMSHIETMGLYTGEYLPLRTPDSRLMSFDGAFRSYLDALELSALTIGDLGSMTGSASASTDLLRLIAPPLRALRHTWGTGLLSDESAKLITPSALEMALVANESLTPTILAALTNPPPESLQRIATEQIATVFDATMDGMSPLWGDHIADIAFKTTMDATMRSPACAEHVFEGAHTSQCAAKMILQWLDNTEVLLYTMYQFMVGHGEAQAAESIFLHSASQFMSGQPRAETFADVLLQNQRQFMEAHGATGIPTAALLHSQRQFLTARGRLQELEAARLHTAHQFMIGQGCIWVPEDVLLRTSYRSMVGCGREQAAEPILLHTLYQSMIGQPDVHTFEDVNLWSALSSANEGSPRTDAPADLLLHQCVIASNRAGHRNQTPSAMLLHLRQIVLQRCAAAQLQGTADNLLYLGPDGLQGHLASQVQDTSAVRLTTDRSEVHIAMGEATEPATVQLVAGPEVSWGMPGEAETPVRTLMFSLGGSLDRAGAGGYAVDPRAPVQTGSNLYIMAAYGVYQEDDILHFVKDGVFFDPVQDESDLYIRSVTLFWMDGTDANVDRECFPEPVQTGSNLYIRHDVFGGE